MSDFIKARKLYFAKQPNNYNSSFNLFYLNYLREAFNPNEHCNCPNDINISKNEKEMLENLINSFTKVNKLKQLNFVDENQLINIMGDFGDNVYLDNDISQIIINNFKKRNLPKLKTLLLDKLKGKKISTSLSYEIEDDFKDKELFKYLKYYIIDIFIESNMDVLDDDLIYALIKENSRNIDILSIVLEYISFFNKNSFNDYLTELFLLDFPVAIKIQIMEILYNENKLHTDNLMKVIEADKNEKLLFEYLSLLEKDIIYEKPGITIVQTMFYGDPEESGIGKSGGLGTLLKSLGNSLASYKDISRIITLSVNNNINQPIITRYLDKHWILRLPMNINEDNTDEFLLKQNYIKRLIRSFFNILNINPDIFHIRYLDNASKAVANLNCELGSNLSFTLTPDPHRNMTDENDSLRFFPTQDLLLNLNKIEIGDQLIEMADGIIGIGTDKVKIELMEYFPQLKTINKNPIFKMIAEGINLNIIYENYNLKNILTSDILKYRLDENMLERPVILNVGRLSLQKGQDKLLKAWGDSELSRDYNLIIIGGSKDNSTPEEKSIMQYFDKFITNRPALKGKFAHIHALPNDIIRSLEKKIIDNAKKIEIMYPPIYVCSSIKEEFGISILESMSESFLTFAPIKGGVKTYIKNGFNGYLIDTSSSDKIADAVQSVIYNTDNTEQDFYNIRKKGKKTVVDNFSIQKISEEFKDFYKNILKEQCSNEL